MWLNWIQDPGGMWTRHSILFFMLPYVALALWLLRMQLLQGFGGYLVSVIGQALKYPEGAWAASSTQKVRVWVQIQGHNIFRNLPRCQGTCTVKACTYRAEDWHPEACTHVCTSFMDLGATHSTIFWGSDSPSKPWSGHARHLGPTALISQVLEETTKSQLSASHTTASMTLKK